MKISAQELAHITGGVLSGETSLTVTGIMTDSRSSGAGHDVLFIALRGPNHDGHRFIEALYHRGVRLFLADTVPKDSAAMTGAGFVTVDDTLEALHKLAKWRRESFGGKVIAVTGSAGKTVVKEWCTHVPQPLIRSPKSYNSQVGVALSLMNIDDRYEAAVIELNSKPGRWKSWHVL
ncbi:MAG: Mur ligase domain-containing protein [Bacteroidales bacterium]|nr:Mur ligase domain-containing protein [Bacteroidales bacterium]